MRNINNFVFFVFITFFLCQCKTKNLSTDQTTNASSLKNETQSFLANTVLVYLDSTSASEAIVTDNVDHFFNRVTITEMAIQMKENRDCQVKSECVEDYKNFLRTDVASFSETDKEKIKPVFAEIASMINKVNANLFESKEIVLIKTKANHYGESVYYTRENKIIIPEDVLIDFNKDSFKATMLHELFHIYSRYNEEQRDQLYKLIGFSPVNGKLIIPEGLENRKLLNPDGTTDYMIKIGDTFAYPMITSTQEKFTRSKPSFFDYLDFKLYELLVGKDGSYTVGNAIPFQEAPQFFSQIKDNTDYIIHPDEVMADNFIYTIFYLAEDKKVKEFSSEGMALIAEIGTILKRSK